MLNRLFRIIYPEAKSERFLSVFNVLEKGGDYQLYIEKVCSGITLFIKELVLMIIFALSAI